MPNHMIFNERPECQDRVIAFLQKMGYEFILWTCRECEDLDDAVAWLEERGIRMETINDNAPSIKALFGGYNSRKINADEYWDDKAVRVTTKEFA